LHTLQRLWALQLAIEPLANWMLMNIRVGDEVIFRIWDMEEAKNNKVDKADNLPSHVNNTTGWKREANPAEPNWWGLLIPSIGTYIYIFTHIYINICTHMVERYTDFCGNCILCQSSLFKRESNLNAALENLAMRSLYILITATLPIIEVSCALGTDSLSR
jgi:hypothetical protein